MKKMKKSKKRELTTDIFLGFRKVSNWIAKDIFYDTIGPKYFIGSVYSSGRFIPYVERIIMESMFPLI